MTVCEICKSSFIPKNKYRTPKTCSKTCKNELARRITLQQFSDPAAREVQRQKSIEQKKNPEYQQKFKRSIERRDARWRKEGHPRLGMKQSDETKEKIGKANTGTFKGKTWEEIYGEDVAARRRIQNSNAMCRINESLLFDRKSKYENEIYLKYLKNLGFEKNKQISKFNVDFLNEETKTIIEFNGDYWHINPMLYDKDFYNTTIKMCAQDKWDIDSKRKSELEQLGYNVFVWWESDIFVNRKINEDAIKAAIEDIKTKRK